MRLKNYCRITLVMLMTMLPLFAWSNTINSADVNEDGKVSISDVTALIDFLLTDDASSIDYWAADVDGSGTVNIADVTELVNILLYGQTIPATRTFTANGVTFMMVYVEPGTFMMGSNDSDASDSAKPAHEVTLTRGFYICQTEVTWALWEAVMGVNPNSHVDSLMNHAGSWRRS